jgi:hypothetical protein
MKVSLGHKKWLSANVQIENDTSEKFKVYFHSDEPLNQMSFHQAADYTATLISKTYDNIHLLLSGGLDSEYVAKVFVRNKLPFTPIIVINQTNIPEVWYAFRFCLENNLTPKILDYSQSYQSHTALLKNLFDLSLKLKLQPNLSLIPNFVSTVIKDASILTGSGDALGRRPDNDYSSYLKPIGNSVSIDGSSFYLNLQSSQHPGPFFVYTPEIFKAFLTEADCTLPLQDAKAKLYEVMPRSKIMLDLHLISDSEILKSMIEKRLKKLETLETEAILDKDDVLYKLKSLDTRPE